MRFGADPHATTAGIYALRDAATPLAIALERGYDEIAAIIREQEKQREEGRPTASDVPAELRRACETGDEDRAIDLLTRQPDLVHVRLFDSRWTLLHVSSALLWPRAAAWLLNHGADVNEPAGDGSTPPDVAGLRCDPRGTAEGRATIPVIGDGTSFSRRRLGSGITGLGRGVIKNGTGVHISPASK